MAKTFATVLATLALASTLLAGCGSTGTGVTASIKSAGATPSATAQDFWSVGRAKKLASNGLSQYNSLRNQWLATYSDTDKDRIEDQMLVVLSQAIGNVRDAVSAESGAHGSNSYQIFAIADRAANQYEELRQQWSMTHDLNAQRQISNQMQTVMVNALNQIMTISRIGG